MAAYLKLRDQVIFVYWKVLIDDRDRSWHRKNAEPGEIFIFIASIGNNFFLDSQGVRKRIKEIHVANLEDGIDDYVIDLRVLYMNGSSEHIYAFEAKGTRGPMIKDSGGVSKKENNWIVFVSPN